jgi:hypothetical protein
MPFPEPFYWCDHRCAQCPLQKSCPIARRLNQLAWRHRAKGRDPESPAARAMDIETERERARAAGVPPADQPELPPQSLEERRIRRAVVRACEAAIAVVELIETEETARALRELQTHFGLLATKAIFLASEKVDADEEWFEEEIVPQLLLLRASIGAARAALESLRRTGANTATLGRQIDELVRLCEPWLARINDAHEKELLTLIARGQAPSPFASV